MNKSKNWRGYCFDVAVTLFKKRVEINIHPFAWNKPMLCVSGKYSLGASWHLNLGCFHVWGMESDCLLALELDAGYLHYWWEKPVCPQNMKRIF